MSNQYSIDISCDTLFLGVSSIDNAQSERNISLFPNPVTDVTRVAMHDYLPQDASIRFYNQAGQPVQKSALSGVTTLIDMTDLMPGVYIYEVWDKNVRLSSGKVVKVE